LLKAGEQTRVKLGSRTAAEEGISRVWEERTELL
jgi:hypothetical protein